MNHSLFRLINEGMKSPFLDWVMPLFSNKDFVIIPGFVAIVIGLYFGTRRTRLCIVAMVAAFIVANIGSEHLLKNIAKEPRPYVAMEGVNLNRSGEWMVYNPEWYQFDRRQSFAFPSTHAANIAAVAVVLAFLRRWTLWITVPAAVLVGLSRIYTGNHFPDAVFWGYVWGAACGFACMFILRWLAKRLLKPEPAVPAIILPVSPERKTFLWILGLWTFVNFFFVYLNRFTLAGDEAQYWDWSRHVALSYYSKPPMIGYIIRILTNAGGSHEWAIRSGAVLFASGSLALVYAMGVRLARRANYAVPDRAGLLAALCAVAMPSSWAGAVIMTVDAPTIFFWALSIYCFHRAVADGPADGLGEAKNTGMWAWTGLALGLGALTKYTIFLLVISFVLYLVLCDRRWLKRPGPYLALALMLVCMSGVIYWNAANDWVSIKHTASINAGGRNSPGKIVSHVFDFFGSQAGMVSPIIFVLYLWAAVTCAKKFRVNRDAAFMFLCFTVLFGFYVLVAFTRKTMANWPVASYIAAAPALALVWEERPRLPRARKWLTAGILLGCCLGVIMRCSDVVYILSMPFAKHAKDPARVYLGKMSFKAAKDPTNEMQGGRELGAALSRWTEKDPANTPFIFSNRYQMNAVAAFYTKGHPHTYCMNPGDRRYNQYDLWGGWDKLVGRDGLFITGGEDERAEAFVSAMVAAGAFESGEYLETVKVWRGKTLVRTFTISRLHKYSGMKMPEPGGKY